MDVVQYQGLMDLIATFSRESTEMANNLEKLSDMFEKCLLYKNESSIKAYKINDDEGGPA